MSTTKKINGVDCPRHAFAYAPSPDPKTWSLPLWIPGDAKKSLNAVKTSLYRFNSAKIPDCEKQRVFDTIRGALLSRGIETARRTFAAKSSDAPATEVTGHPPCGQPVEPPPPLPEVKTKPVKKDPMVEAVIAEADRRATALLKRLGY